MKRPRREEYSFCPIAPIAFSVLQRTPRSRVYLPLAYQISQYYGVVRACGSPHTVLSDNGELLRIIIHGSVSDGVFHASEQASHFLQDDDTFFCLVVF